MRGFAILCVIIGHFASPAVLTAHGWVRPFYLILFPFERTAVPIFVILSSFGIARAHHSKRPSSRALSIIISRIIPAYIFWYVTYYLTRQFYAGRTIEVKGLILSLITFDSLRHLWFLLMIAQVYLIVPWLVRLFDHAKAKYIIISAFLIQVTAGAGIAQLAAGSSFEQFAPGLVTDYLLFAIIGVYLGTMDQNQLSLLPRSKRNLMFCVASAVLLSAISTILFAPAWLKTIADSSFNRRLALPYISIASFGIFFLLSTAIRRHRGRLWGWASSLGLYSFGIYLFHFHVIDALIYIQNGLQFFSPAIFPAVGIVLTTIISLILVRSVSRLSLTKYFL